MYSSYPHSGTICSSSHVDSKSSCQPTVVYPSLRIPVNMKFVERISNFASRKLVALGILLGAMSWLLESYIHSQIFYDHQRDFLFSLLLPDKHELWMRFIIVVRLPVIRMVSRIRTAIKTRAVNSAPISSSAGLPSYSAVPYQQLARMAFQVRYF